MDETAVPPSSDPSTQIRLSRRHVGLGIAASLILLPSRLPAQPSSMRGDAPAQPASDTAPKPELKDTAAPVPPRELKAAPAMRQLRPKPAKETALWLYGDSLPGPALRVKQGETLDIALANGLPQPTSVHWHGVHVPNAMDGVAGLTQEPVPPQGNQQVKFTAQDAGTYWYRPLVPALAAEQTERGLSGLFIVDEAEPQPFDQDIALELDDWALDDGEQIRPSFGEPAEVALAGRLGNFLTVNGAVPPRRLTVAPGARLRVRVLNAANARAMTLRFDGAIRVHVIAVDGQPSEVFEPARGSIALMPGTRLDLAVEAPAGAGEAGALLLALGTGVPVLVVEADGSAPSRYAGTPVARLPSNRLPERIPLQSATRAHLVIAGGRDPSTLAPEAPVTLPDPARAWTFNGIAWPDARKKPVLSVKSGRPVTIAFENKTRFMQALHIHGHHVRLLHGLDDGWEPYWLDTVPVAPGRTARIAFIAETPGRWMISSTFLERLSGGLAAWFEVT